MKLAIAAIVKNELSALPEWIAYHRLAGVSTFLIADNGSTDGTREVLGALQQLGMLTVIDVPDQEGVRPQLGAY
ncbi:MAG: glycosyltransferase family 2 protein, partial [Gammaproteobacteria bacterium]|nr:glycosyltransferase family 2 protein [Gammaproteobacteria bacterium]